MINFELISVLPNIEQADCRMKSIKDCKWHGGVNDYEPRSMPEEL